MRGADAISPRFLGSGRCGHGHSCPTGLCVRAHEEVQFRLVSRQNTFTMTSRLSVVNVSLTEADNSYARRELLSDRSFDITSTRILNQTSDEEDTEWPANSAGFEDDQLVAEKCCWMCSRFSTTDPHTDVVFDGLFILLIV